MSPPGRKLLLWKKRETRLSIALKFLLQETQSLLCCQPKSDRHGSASLQVSEVRQMWETWGGAETKTALVGMGGAAGVNPEERHIGLDTENEWLPWKKSSLDSHELT